MDRKEFFQKVGFGAAALLVPACIAGLATSCSKDDNGSSTPAPTNVDFTLDVSTGSLATDGGFLVSNGIVVARKSATEYIAVSAKCPHEGYQVNYVANNNNFHCSSNHGGEFSSTGAVTHGPASSNLTQYKTTLTNTSLRVFS
jgi:cytochrome b6-f complex iron-sulfur subunit